MLISVLVIIFALAIVHSSHVLIMLHMLTQEKLPFSVTFLRPLALCLMGAFCQHSLTVAISGNSLSIMTIFVFVITNALFFIGLNSAFRAKMKVGTEES